MEKMYLLTSVSNKKRLVYRVVVSAKSFREARLKYKEMKIKDEFGRNLKLISIKLLKGF